MKIIIIGAKGMLGQQLAEVFKEHELLLWDLNNIDITNEQIVDKKLLEEKANIVINAAAYNDVDGAEENDALANKVNGLAVGYLARAVKEYKGILVHFSSDYVFRGDNKDGYMETDKPDPQIAYAKSKYKGELELHDNYHKYYLIRLSRLFGPPAISETAKISFIEKIIELSKKQEEIDVINEELSCVTYAPDLAKATKQLVESEEFGTYHITNSGTCTWYDLAKEVFDQLNLNVKLNPISSNFFKRSAPRPIYSVLVNTKLPLLRPWQEALKEYLTKYYNN